MDAIRYVNPYIGTQYDPQIHVWGKSDYGGTVPYVTAPFGMTKWCAQTRENCVGRAVYCYNDSSIMGFMATHQPAIWMGDYGYLSIMPQIGALKTKSVERALPFERAQEQVSPYEYGVRLQADGKSIAVRMTATERCGVMRFTFPAGEAKIYIEVTRAGCVGTAAFGADGSTLTCSNPDRMDANLSDIPLPNFAGHYALQFSVPYAECGMCIAGQDAMGQTSGENLGAWVAYHFAEKTEVEVRVGSSFISCEQAQRNLMLETNGREFEDLARELRTTWNEKLGKICIETADEEKKRIFYTGLYHAMLFPNAIWEEDRYYSAFDDHIHEGKMYTSFSIWDTFRAENSLLTLLFPERVDGMVQSLLSAYQQGGYLPKWPNPSYTNIMISTHADSLVAEAVEKGFNGFDYELAWQAVYKDGMVPPPLDRERKWRDRDHGLPYEARAGLSYLLEMGYIPTDRTAEAASRTIEGSYDDWCIARVGMAAGHAQEAEYFMQRSRSYQKLFHAPTGLLRGRKSDGSFDEDDQGWTEGGQWNYHFFTPHDMEGMVGLVGKERYLAQLDDYFAKGRNFHPNEPSHHVPYLYALLGEREKARYWVHRIAEENYADDPAAGLTGNEDCGQMSAWYIFTALGFYPVHPASGEYVLVCPLVARARMDVGENRVFCVEKRGNGSRVSRILLNGREITSPTIHYRDIMAGGELVFVMEET